MAHGSSKHVANDWYHSFFSGMAIDFWSGIADEQCTQQENSLLNKVFSTLAPGSRLLDVLCGTGRHTTGLIQAGFSLCGIDLSRNMLLKAKADNPNATFYEGDALQLADVMSQEAPFAGVYCLGNSLGYFDAEGMTRFLEGISQKLQAGGLLVLHSDMVAEVLLPHWEAHMEVIANGIYAIADNEDYDLQSSRLITRFSFEKEDEETGKISKEAHLIQHYIYTVGEISRMLSQSGCRLLSGYGDVKGKPFVIGDAHWYGIFQKN